jgi:uncharacterized membrane protein
MELKGFDDKKSSPLLGIAGAVVAVLVGIWVLKRILGTIFMLAQIGIFIVLVVAVAGVINKYLNKKKS